jgi:hypothetical protein
MSCRFTELIIDAEDPHALAAFWQQVLAYDERDRGDDIVEIAGPPGTGPSLVFLRVPERKSLKNRLHIDVNATDRDQPAELERLLSLGARRVDIGQGDDVSWHVLADPEGNEFCLLASRVDADAPWPPT